jgi:RHS repeat-associated protein
MINPDGGTTYYSYDDLNRVSALTDSQSQATSYAYDAAGNLINVTYPNSAEAVYTHNELNRLTSLINKNGLTVISSYQYAYNAAGLRTKATFNNGDYIIYTYDKLSRLLKEYRRNQSRKLLYSIEYTYDALGNRLTQSINIVDANFKIADLPTKSNLVYAYNAANQLINLKVYEVMGRDAVLNNETNYSYDANGNLIQEDSTQGITDYVYDYENRLTSVTTPSANASYAYDGEGKKISQVEDGLAANFLYDGMSVILERDSSNQTAASYTRGLFYPGGIGGIISCASVGGSSYYSYDGLGSVTNLTDSSGLVTQSYTYDAFGNILKQSGAATDPYKFQTKENSSIGLVYFGTRWYNPIIGRWLTPDPAGMIDGPNLYVYLNNNPVNLVDPWGLCKEEKIEEEIGLVEDYFGIDLLVLGIIAAIEPTPAGEVALVGRITGYTKHGIDQAIGREGKGVAVKAILDAVRNPVKVIQQSGGKIKYIGRQATVIVNKVGKIITTWGQPRL